MDLDHTINVEKIDRGKLITAEFQISKVPGFVSPLFSPYGFHYVVSLI